MKLDGNIHFLSGFLTFPILGNEWFGNPKQQQVSTNKNLMDTACFYQGNPMNTCMQDTTKNEACECIFTLISYACPYMQARAYRPLMQVTSQLFSPAHSPSELAPMHVQAITLLLVAQALDASCIYTDKIRYFFQEWV